MRRVTVVVTGPSAAAGSSGRELIAHRLCGGDPVGMLQVHLVSRPRGARPPVFPYRVTLSGRGAAGQAPRLRVLTVGAFNAGEPLFLRSRTSAGGPPAGRGGCSLAASGCWVSSPAGFVPPGLVPVSFQVIGTRGSGV